VQAIGLEVVGGAIVVEEDGKEEGGGGGCGESMVLMERPWGREQGSSAGEGSPVA
jgi:hypothetical protein